MTDHTETEVKLYCPDLETVRQRLESAGAELVAPRVFERNVRYENDSETLTANGIVVRLREDTRIRLTYKGPGTVAEGIMSRFEAEVEVSDFDTMSLILEHLGYRTYMTYEKYRTTYTLDGAEIVLDEMPFGNFVEIEGHAGAIEQIVAKLDMQAARRYGYSYTGLFDHVKHYLGLTFRDLTFANFDGIDVPESAFEGDAP